MSSRLASDRGSPGGQSHCPCVPLSSWASPSPQLWKASLFQPRCFCYRSLSLLPAVPGAGTVPSASLSDSRQACTAQKLPREALWCPSPHRGQHFGPKRTCFRSHLRYSWGPVLPRALTACLPGGSPGLGSVRAALCRATATADEETEAQRQVAPCDSGRAGPRTLTSPRPGLCRGSQTTGEGPLEVVQSSHWAGAAGETRPMSRAARG